MNANTEFWSVITYGIYAVVSCSVTVWVARTLRLHVPRFFTSGDEHDNELTESMTRLIIMGFYLVNFGAISLALKSDSRILGRLDAMELLSSKVGMVLLIQGIVHFGILIKLFGIRDNGKHQLSPMPVSTGQALDSPGID